MVNIRANTHAKYNNTVKIRSNMVNMKTNSIIKYGKTVNKRAMTFVKYCNTVDIWVNTFNIRTNMVIKYGYTINIKENTVIIRTNTFGKCGNNVTVITNMVVKAVWSTYGQFGQHKGNYGEQIQQCSQDKGPIWSSNLDVRTT